MSTELPDYFENFKPTRVPIGEAVYRKEMIRRLAHYLQVPQKFGVRLLNAFESVISDALAHGEGISIRNAGLLTLHEYPTNYTSVCGQEVERAKLFYYKWYVSNEARRFVKDITKMKKEGTLDAFLTDV